MFYVHLSTVVTASYDKVLIGTAPADVYQTELLHMLKQRIKTLFVSHNVDSITCASKLVCQFACHLFKLHLIISGPVMSF